MVVPFAAGLLTSTRRPGRHVLGSLLGIAYLCLGVSSITVSDQPGIWRTPGGALSIAVGAACLALTYREARATDLPRPLALEVEPVAA